MPPDPIVLAFDTSAAHCAVALLCGQDLLAARVDEMARGQAEHLMPMMVEVLSGAGLDWPNLAAIGVGVGPGNFTGIRISVSAARGLALSLEVQAIGVTGFEAITLGRVRPIWATLPAPRERVYARYQSDTAREPVHMLAEDFAAQTAQADAPILDLTDISAARFVENIARRALAKLGQDNPRPTPLYMRAADAAPSRDKAPAILP